jgi:hypothetical protein
VTVNARTPEIDNQDLKVSRCVQISVFTASIILREATLERARGREMFGARSFWLAVKPDGAQPSAGIQIVTQETSR